MLQNMIMFVCVRCVCIVTTKCKGMRQNHLDKHDDQEMISHLYISIIFYIHIHAQQEKLVRKYLHLVKYEQKNGYKI